MATIFTCPMHPEIQAAQPGSCPKCGMALVSTEEAAGIRPSTEIDSTWRKYLPLIVVVGMILFAAAAASWNEFFGGRSIFPEFLIHFMTGFFLVFSGFKLMDLRGFAQGYATYDLLAQRFFAYGYIYPFLELYFGLTMLAGYHPDWLLWTEFIVMVFSGLGVLGKLRRRERFQCACLGTFLKVPLTTVTLVEDFGMALLALGIILF